MAMHANTNMDVPENKKQEKIMTLEQHYDQVIDVINGNAPVEDEAEMTEDQQSFMKAARRGQAIAAPPRMPGEETISNLN